MGNELLVTSQRRSPLQDGIVLEIKRNESTRSGDEGGDLNSRRFPLGDETQNNQSNSSYQKRRFY